MSCICGQELATCASARIFYKRGTPGLGAEVMCQILTRCMAGIVGVTLSCKNLGTL